MRGFADNAAAQPMEIPLWRDNNGAAQQTDYRSLLTLPNACAAGAPTPFLPLVLRTTGV